MKYNQHATAAAAAGNSREATGRQLCHAVLVPLFFSQPRRHYEQFSSLSNVSDTKDVHFFFPSPF